jgi:hypothetical protein
MSTDVSGQDGVVDKCTFASDDQIAIAYIQHCNRDRIDSKTHFFNLIKNKHRGACVTEASSGAVSLMDFVKSGWAVAEPQGTEIATRYWCTDKRKLENSYRYGCWKYVWSDREYTVYYISYRSVLEPSTDLFYIVSSLYEYNDNLIETVGEWTSKRFSSLNLAGGRRVKRSGIRSPLVTGMM